jgi:hypothetical protein
MFLENHSNTIFSEEIWNRLVRGVPMSPTSPSSWVPTRTLPNPEPQVATSDEYARSLTVGHWSTEVGSAEAFDEAITDKWWTVYREVSGVLLQPRPAQLDGSVRIDRVLIPRKPLLDLGWTHGAIGVELKRTGEKIGQPIAQAIDYSRSAFTLTKAGNVRVVLDWVFIWPMAKQSGTVASVLAQNRIGSATPGNSEHAPCVSMMVGHTRIAQVDIYGNATIGDHVGNGRKVGRR